MLFSMRMPCCMLCGYGFLQMMGKRILLISTVSQGSGFQELWNSEAGPTIGVRFAALKGPSFWLAPSGTGVRRGRRALFSRLSRVNLVNCPQKCCALTTVATLSGGLRNTEIELVLSGEAGPMMSRLRRPSTLPYPNTVIGRAKQRNCRLAVCDIWSHPRTDIETTSLLPPIYSDATEWPFRRCVGVSRFTVICGVA